MVLFSTVSTFEYICSWTIYIQKIQEESKYSNDIQIRNLKYSYIAVSRIISNSIVDQINNLPNKSKHSYIAVSIITSNSKVLYFSVHNYTVYWKIIQCIYIMIEIMIVFFDMIKQFDVLYIYIHPRGYIPHSI